MSTSASLIPEVEPSYRGKVRNLYDLGDTMVLVATDRISAFDVVFEESVPGKGQVLTRISNHWFKLIDLVENHLIETDIAKFPEPFSQNADELRDRAVYVKKADRVDFECVVRGYLMGSGYKEYQKTQSVCGNPLPAGLGLGDRLPEPIFTPTTKSDEKDEPVTYEEMAKELGDDLAGQLRKVSIDLFSWASEKLASQGIMLMDTKFEFGLVDGKIVLIDEVLTPDSSRFCDKQEYEAAHAAGKTPPSMDKQVLRNYLETLSWDKKPPAPALPEQIINDTLARYQQIEKAVLCIS